MANVFVHSWVWLKRHTFEQSRKKQNKKQLTWPYLFRSSFTFYLPWKNLVLRTIKKKNKNKENNIYMQDDKVIFFFSLLYFLLPGCLFIYFFFLVRESSRTNVEWKKERRKKNGKKMESFLIPHRTMKLLFLLFYS